MGQTEPPEQTEAVDRQPALRPVQPARTFEIALDEIETHQSGHSRVLRSKSPEMVRQESWGILLAHYAVRALILDAAHEADIDPDRPVAAR
jgi:hypothetical protein